MHCEDISGNTIKDQYEWAQSYLTQWQRKTNKKESTRICLMICTDNMASQF